MMQTNSTFLEIAQRLIARPTAPFREHWVCEELDRLLGEIPGIEIDTDKFGNRIARLRRGEPVPGTKAVFVAHLDHPGFVFPDDGAVSQDGNGSYEAAFEGRVQDRFFPGAKVRLFRSAGDEGIAGRIADASPVDPKPDLRRIRIETEGNAEGARLAMWDVPLFEVRDGLLHARVCDDLAGCAAMIEALRRMAAAKGDIDVAMVFSRAEEAGFCGVIAMLGEDTMPALLPPEAVFLSVETSGETGANVLGSGALIRVGDRSSTFDATISDLLWALAQESQVNAHRALMDRGTCEATPFAQAGLRAGGVCIPLRNYHNQDMEAGVIAPEAIDLNDAEALVDLIVLLSTALSEGRTPPPARKQDFDLYLRKGREHLHPVPIVPSSERAGGVSR